MRTEAEDGRGISGGLRGGVLSAVATGRLRRIHRALWEGAPGPGCEVGGQSWTLAPCRRPGREAPWVLGVLQVGLGPSGKRSGRNGGVPA